MKFMPFDEVDYIGKKFAGALHGVKGTVSNRVSGSDHEVVVDFDGDAYVMDERTCLTRSRGKQQKTEQDNHPVKKEQETEITTRRGGGKRRPAQQETE